MKLVTLAALAALWAAPVMATSIFYPAECATAAELDRLLRDETGEQIIASSSSHAGQSWLHWENAETGSWTIVVLNPEGNMGCILAFGGRYTHIEAAAEPNL